MYINNNAKVKVAKEVSSRFCSKSGVKQFLCSKPIWTDYFDGLGFKDISKHY